MSPGSMVKRLRAGERSAFDEIAALHGQALRATARRLLGCPETAAEVVQDVLFRLWRDREELTVREHLAGYLRRAVRNRALDQIKRRRIESRWLERETMELARHQTAPEGSDHADDREHAIARALEELPPKRRQAVILRWRDGLSYQEIADRLAISVKTVENQLGRALKTLRAAVGAG